MCSKQNHTAKPGKDFFVSVTQCWFCTAIIKFSVLHTSATLCCLTQLSTWLVCLRGKITDLKPFRMVCKP